MATRMIVVGLDGATFDLIKPWVAEGKLPAFARLMAEGAHAELRSTLPLASTSTATSAATGKNPGNHGIYDRSRTQGDLHGRRVWDIAAAHGRRVGLVRLPLTDDTKGMEGGCVISEIPATNGVDGDVLGIANVRAFRDEAFDLQRMQNAEMLNLLGHGEWDLLWVTFDTLGKVQRFFWHYMDPTHPAHPGPSDLGDTILRSYELVDDCLAEIVKRLDDRTGLLLVSDHGSCAAESYLALADWLEEAGFQKTHVETGSPVQRALNGIGKEAYAFLRALRRSGLGWLPNLMPQRPKANLEATKASACVVKSIDWSATRVFCQSAANGGLRVNLRGRESDGIVAPEDFDAVREEVRTALLQLADPATGRKVVRAVHLREEIFRGPHLEDGPDLLVETNDPYGIVEGIAGAVIVPAGRHAGERTGNRTRMGIFILAGGPARRGAAVPTLDVCDVAPTLLHLMELPEPADVDGIVAEAALAEAHLAGRPARAAVPTLRDVQTVGTRDHDRRIVPGTTEGLGYQ